jgi:hypothetical protein
LNGFARWGFDPCRDDDDACYFGHMFMGLIGAPVLVALDARSFEVAVDVGADNKRQYALLLGFGI